MRAALSLGLSTSSGLQPRSLALVASYLCQRRRPKHVQTTKSELACIFPLKELSPYLALAQLITRTRTHALVSAPYTSVRIWTCSILIYALADYYWREFNLAVLWLIAESLNKVLTKFSTVISSHLVSMHFSWGLLYVHSMSCVQSCIHPADYQSTHTLKPCPRSVISSVFNAQMQILSSQWTIKLGCRRYIRGSGGGLPSWPLVQSTVKTCSDKVCSFIDEKDWIWKQGRPLGARSDTKIYHRFL